MSSCADEDNKSTVSHGLSCGLSEWEHARNKYSKIEMLQQTVRTLISELVL